MLHFYQVSCSAKEYLFQVSLHKLVFYLQIEWHPNWVLLLSESVLVAFSYFYLNFLPIARPSSQMKL